jgi:hypothetical protein
VKVVADYQIGFVQHISMFIAGSAISSRTPHATGVDLEKLERAAEATGSQALSARRAFGRRFTMDRVDAVLSTQNVFCSRP